MLKMRPIAVSAAIALLLFAFSCSKDSGSGNNANCTTTKSFTTEALPAMQTYCSANSSCHGAGSVAGPGALTTYSQIYANRATVSLSMTTGSMPPGTTLPTTAYNDIVCWISQGAANN